MKTNNIILKGKLEKAPLALFTDKRYKKIRKNEFENKCGVYALYNKKGGLYYVGRASNMKGRLYNHLQNEHSKNWHYFSVYFTSSEQQARELESIFISIDKPKGNTQKPSLKTLDKEMRRRIEKNMKNEDQERRKFGAVSVNKKSKLKKVGKGKVKVGAGKNRTARANKRKSLKSQSGKGPTLMNPFGEDRPLRAEYKGQIHKAKWLKPGYIRFKGEEYSSPSGAFQKATGLRTNGKLFWETQDHQKRWITLNELEKRGALKKVA